MKFKKLPPAGEKVVMTTLKGKAMIAAHKAGMLSKAKTADGYNIMPFLKFWEQLEPDLEEALKQCCDYCRMIEKESESGPSKEE